MVKNMNDTFITHDILKIISWCNEFQFIKSRLNVYKIKQCNIFQLDATVPRSQKIYFS